MDIYELSVTGASTKDSRLSYHGLDRNVPNPITVMEISPPPYSPPRGANKGLESSTTRATTPGNRRDLDLPSLLQIPHRTTSKRRGHYSLPRLQSPSQNNQLPVQLLISEQEDSPLSASSTTKPTRYRQNRGEVHESIQAPAAEPDISRVSTRGLFDPNFLELIRSAENSREVTGRGDQSPTSSDSSASTIREISARSSLFNTYSDKLLLFPNLNLPWTTTSMIQHLFDDRAGPPVEAAKNGLRTTFQETISEDQTTLKHGQKLSDQKTWNDGFDAAVFVLSTQIDVETRKRVHGLLPFKLRGTQKAAQEYCTSQAALLRRKNAWREIWDALHQYSASERLTKEFEKVADDFFSGRPVEVEYETGGAIFSTEPKPYNLEFRKGDRTKVLQTDPLADKTLALFLEDLVMANEMEKAYTTKGNYQNGLKVYRHESHQEVFNKLQQASKVQEVRKLINVTTGREETLEQPMIFDDALEAAGLNHEKFSLIGTREGLGIYIQNEPSDSAAQLQIPPLTSLDDFTITTVTVEDVPGTTGGPPTLKSVSPRQASTVERTSTGLSNISKIIPESPTTAEISSLHEASVGPSRLAAPIPRVATPISNPSSPRKVSKAQGEAETSTKDNSQNNSNVTELETTSFALKVESPSRKKTKGKRSKTGRKGKGNKKNKVPSSSLVIQDLEDGTISQEQPSESRSNLGTKVHTEAQTISDDNISIEDFHGPEDAAISEVDSGWNEVKPRVTYKSRGSKRVAGHPLPKTKQPICLKNGTQQLDEVMTIQLGPPNHAKTGNFRESRSEEYPAIPSGARSVDSTDDQSKGVFPTTDHLATLPAVQTISWEDTVKNLTPGEAEPLRVMSRESQHSIALFSACHRGNADATEADVHATPSEHHSTQQPIPAGSRASEKIEIVTETQSTGLEWAAAELTSPTKVRSEWRHSSLPRRSTTPSLDETVDSVEISTNRRRSTTTTSLNPRVRVIQFGDFPLALSKSAEVKSTAHSGLTSSPRSVANASSTHHEQGSDTNKRSVFTASSLLPDGVQHEASMRVAVQVPMSQPPFAPPPFMPQQYPPYGAFPTEPGYYIGETGPHAIPYGLPAPGSRFPPPPMASFNSGSISNHGHPFPIMYGYSPNASNGPGIWSDNHQQLQQDLQQGGRRGESSTSRSRSGESRSDQIRSPESFGSLSNIELESAQPTSQQGTSDTIGYTCSYCFKAGVSSNEQPLYFCPGCGVACAIRYCSAACLLAHSWAHSFCCMQYAYYDRMDPHAMPPESFEYDRCYLSPVESRTEKETRERYRQRAFSMYCWHGSFPPILNSWATRNELPVGLTGFDVNERFKKTGDYHIFRSEVSANGKPFPRCEVICTVRLRNGDPMKEALNRALNACLLYLHPRVVCFLFRLLRHLIMDLETFSYMTPVLDQRTIHAEFIQQFGREFSFDALAHAEDMDTFDLTEDWKRIRLDMEDLEMQFQVLRCWFRTKSQSISSPLEPRDA